MMYLRKINPDAWNDKPSDDADSISDLATTNHELSVWEVEDMADLNSIALALAMTLSEPRPFIGILINPDEIQKNYDWNLDIISNPGMTMYKSKKDKHKDFILQNVEHMRMMADYIHNIIKNEDLTRVCIFNELFLNDEAMKKFESKEITVEDLDQEKNKGGKWGKMCRTYFKENNN